MFNKNKIGLAVITASLLFTEVCAVPAYPGLRKLLQPDGTSIFVRTVGDEYAHLLVDSEGRPLHFDATTGCYRLTGESAHEVPALLQRLRNGHLVTHQPFVLQPRTAAASDHHTMRISDVPTLGSHKALVVLVQFSDRQFSMTDAVDYYDRYFHDINFRDNGARGCVTEWFREGSFYQYDPEFDVIGPVTVSYSSTELAGTDGIGDTWKMIQQVVSLIDEQVDFSQYDTDGNGTCDNIYCIYAGYGQADSYYDDVIWPHSGNLSETEIDGYMRNKTVQADEVTIDRYTVSAELNGQTGVPVGMGTFVHEFGHVLGLADHYCTTGATSFNLPGYWDVMAYGPYCDDQNCPPLFTAFERYSLDWLQPTQLTTAADTLIDVPILADSNIAYRVDVPGKSYEYYLIENRQQRAWDRYIPGHGALVWHIDEDQTVWDANMVNGVAGHPRVDIVEAGGTTSYEGLASDPFPGSKRVTQYHFTDWSKKEIFAFVDVQERSGTVCLRLDGTNYRLDAPMPELTEVSGRSVRIDWERPYLGDQFDVELLQSDSLIMSNTITDSKLLLSELEPECDYQLRISSRCMHLTSDTIAFYFSTLPLQVFEQTAVALPATDVTETSFTAHWEAMPLATSYIIVLYSRESTGVSEVGTGFDNATASDYQLPEGWSTDVTTSPSSQYYGENSPSFRFNTNGTYLLASQSGSALTQVSFWHRSNNSGNALIVEQLVGNEWVMVGDTIRAASGVAVQEVLPLDEAQSVRLTYLHKMGYLLIDDIYVTYRHDEYNWLFPTEVVGTEYYFCNLDPTVRFSYDVVATDGTNFSAFSNRIDVEQPAAIQKLRVDALSEKRLYDLMGRRVSSPQPGLLYIKR